MLTERLSYCAVPTRDKAEDILQERNLELPAEPVRCAWTACAWSGHRLEPHKVRDGPRQSQSKGKH